MSARDDIQKRLAASKKAFSNLSRSITTRTANISKGLNNAPTSPQNVRKNVMPYVRRAEQATTPLADKIGNASYEISGIRPFARLAARTAVSAQGRQEYIPGAKGRKGLDKAAEDLLIGKDKVTSFRKGTKDLNKDLQKYISPGKAKYVAPGLIAAGSLLDLVPLGVDDVFKQGGKKVGKESIESLAQSNADEILEKAASRIGKYEKPKKSLKQLGDELYTDWVNAWHPIESYVTQIQKKAGYAIPNDLNPKFKIKNLLGSGGAAQYRHQKVLKPIIDEISDLPKDMFDVFLAAKRDLGFEEVGRAIKGSDPEEAKRTITALTEKFGPDNVKRMEATAEKLYRYQDEMLEKLFKTGFIDSEGLQLIKERNKNYVPYQRIMNKVDESLGISNSSMVGSKPDMLKEIKGSEKQILSPLQSIIGDTYKIEALVAKNDLARSVVGLKDFFDDGSIKVLKSAEATKKRFDILTDLHENKLSRNTVKRALRTNKTRIRLLRRELGQIHSVALRAEQRLDKMSAIPKTTTRLKSVRFQGDELIGGKVVTDKTREFAYGAIKQIVKEKDSKKFLYKLMSLPAEDLKLMLSKAGVRADKVTAITRDVEGLRESLGALEAEKNMLRDSANALRAASGKDKYTISAWKDGVKEIYEVTPEIEAAMKGLDQESMNAVVKMSAWITGIFRQGQTGRNIDFMIPNMVKDQLDAAITSKYGYTPFVDWVRGVGHLIKHDVGGGDELVKQWMENGGALAYRNASAVENLAEQLDPNTKKKLTKQIAEWAVGGLETVGRYSETPTRLGVFEKAMKGSGGDVAESVLESREATVDFARMGAKMKTANAFIPFLNPSVQGFDKMLRVAKNNPKQFAFRLTAFAGIPAATLAIYNNTFYPKEYANVPDWEKNSNFIFMTGSDINGKPTYYKIPKGNVVPLVANPTESFISYLYGNDQESFKALALSLLSEAVPVLGDGSNFSEIARNTVGDLIPQSIKPSVEAGFNVDFFKGKPIEPSFMQKRDPEYRYNQYTPRTYKAIGQALNMSPLKIEKVLEGYLASGAKMPTEIIETLADLKAGDEVDINQIPILRRFFGNYEDFGSGKGLTPAGPKNLTPTTRNLTPAESKLTPIN